MSQKPPQSTILLGTGPVLTTEESISSHVPTSRGGLQLALLSQSEWISSTPSWLHPGSEHPVPVAGFYFQYLMPIPVLQGDWSPASVKKPAWGSDILTRAKRLIPPGRPDPILVVWRSASSLSSAPQKSPSDSLLS